MLGGREEPPCRRTRDSHCPLKTERALVGKSLQRTRSGAVNWPHRHVVRGSFQRTPSLATYGPSILKYAVCPESRQYEKLQVLSPELVFAVVRAPTLKRPRDRQLCPHNQTIRKYLLDNSSPRPLPQRQGYVLRTNAVQLSAGGRSPPVAAHVKCPTNRGLAPRRSSMVERYWVEPAVTASSRPGTLL
jgi:hypothetical protein